MQKFNEVLELLYEKDHRRTLVDKMGIPEDLADHLHGLSSKHSLWFANQLIKMQDYKRVGNKLAWFRSSLRTQTQAIMDWISGADNVNIRGYDWEGAINASQEWHDELALRASNDFTPKDIPEGADVIMTFPDGFYWLDLNDNRCSAEGNAMGHCGSAPHADTLLSLRDKTGNPHVTIGASPNDGIWTQCKGKGNQKPNSEYTKYIVKILIELEIFEHKSEYEAGSDFNSEDFSEYVTENPDEFENSDDILQKIEDSTNREIEEAEKLADEYNAKLVHGSIYVYSDDPEYADVDISFSLGIEAELVKNINYSDTDDMHEFFNISIEEIDISTYDKSIDIGVRMVSENIYTGLVDRVESANDTLTALEEDYAEIRAKIAQYFYEEGYIRNLPNDLQLIWDYNTDDDDEFLEGEELSDFVDNDGVLLYRNKFKWDTEDMNKIIDSVSYRVSRSLNKILSHMNETQTEFTFEAYTAVNTTNTPFIVKLSHHYMGVNVEVFIRNDDFTNDDKYTRLYKYMRDGSGNNIVTKALSVSPPLEIDPNNRNNT